MTYVQQLEMIIAAIWIIGFFSRGEYQWWKLCIIFSTITLVLFALGASIAS